MLQSRVSAEEFLILWQWRIGCKRVKQLHLERALSKSERFVLRMNVENMRSQFLQELKTCRRVVDKRATLGRGQNFATKNKRIVIVCIIANKHLLKSQVGNIKCGFDYALAPLIRKHLGVSPLT